MPGLFDEQPTKQVTVGTGWTSLEMSSRCYCDDCRRGSGGRTAEYDRLQVKNHRTDALGNGYLNSYRNLACGMRLIHFGSGEIRIDLKKNRTFVKKSHRCRIERQVFKYF